MFAAAQNALNDNPKLKKVILLEHSPRYDMKDVDPLNLKPALANYANNTFAQLWLDSPQKDQIFIGQHNLATGGSGIVHNDRFLDVRTMKYDGVHFYGRFGRKSYTKSVKNIIQRASLQHSQNHSPCQKPHYNPQTSQQHQEQQSDNNSSPPNYHQKCPQTVFQQKQMQNKTNPSKSNYQYQPSVKVANRFSVFNSNQGNC